MPQDVEQHRESSFSQAVGILALLAMAVSLSLPGCERREKILDVDAPGISIEVDKKTNPDGSKSIEVETKKPSDQPATP